MKKDKKDIIIVTPVYNDWSSFSFLVEQINHLVINLETINSLIILAIDDGSSAQPDYKKLKNKNVEIIHLTIACTI